MRALQGSTTFLCTFAGTLRSKILAGSLSLSLSVSFRLRCLARTPTKSARRHLLLLLYARLLSSAFRSLTPLLRRPDPRSSRLPLAHSRQTPLLPFPRHLQQRREVVQSCPRSPPQARAARERLLVRAALRHHHWTRPSYVVAVRFEGWGHADSLLQSSMSLRVDTRSQALLRVRWATCRSASRCWTSSEKGAFGSKGSKELC